MAPGKRCSINGIPEFTSSYVEKQLWQLGADGELYTRRKASGVKFPQGLNLLYPTTNSCFGFIIWPFIKEKYALNCIKKVLF